ncbi:MAG: 16S rRNA (adenine(1518)-N(6)/adenine(1519)-N(6))-dimethyltransferase RsmA [Candidatus Nomurabacteria bacterium]|jgi:16S rRNA (adenine1518-N6/adenine1519-N6)-dimethyltransferase|nr:16S rRNA (adenine(1518)-N(6)/adenine(1519)-N(6))-dimethyltransferase RsmA [Candidatus Nomurabacteria bacterium]
MVVPKKSLGQHWLKDRAILTNIAAYANIEGNTVLEIGPGLGFLTSVLLTKAAKVVAVEYDAELARKLPASFPGKNLEVVNADFLQYDLSQLPSGYKVVANVPYYITSKIVQKLLTANNKPSEIVLLVQKEVAERLAAGPGELSILGISAQVYADVELGEVVPARLFTPPPKVDSQVVVIRPFALCKGHPCKTHPCKTSPFARVTLAKPLAGSSKDAGTDAEKNTEREFFKLVKVGFSSPRKKVVSNLANGLHKDRTEVEAWFDELKLDRNLRAQDLSIADWIDLLHKAEPRKG